MTSEPERTTGPGDRIASLFDRHRGLVALFVVGISAFAAFGFLKEQRGRTLESRLDAEAFALLKSTQDDFNVAKSELFLVAEAEDLFSVEAVGAMRSLLATVRAHEGVGDVLALDRIPVVEGLSVSMPLLPGVGATVAEHQEARGLARKHELVEDQLLSADERLLVMPVQLLSEFATQETALEIDELARRAVEGGPLRAYATGLLPIFAESESVFAKERVFFMIAGFALAAIFAILLFKSIAAVIIAGLAPGIGVLWTLGTLSWMGQAQHDMTAIVLPILLMMIGFTDGIHLIVHVRKSRREGCSPREAAASSLAHLGSACMWTSITTAIGFGSLMLAGSEYAGEFGQACAIGVLLTFLAVVTTIPLLAGSRFARGIHHGWSRDPVDAVVRGIERLVELILRHSTLITVGSLVATVGMLFVALQLRPNSRFWMNMPDGSESYAALLRVDDALGGVQFGRIVISWPEETEEDSILAAIADVEAVLGAEELYRGVLSIRDLQSVLPAGSSSLANVSLLPAALRRAFLNLEERRTLVTMRIRDLGYLHYQDAYDRTDVALAGLESEYPGFEFKLTGEPVFYGRNLAEVTTDLVVSLALAAGVILIVLWFLFRSWKIGLLSILPNVFPLVVTASLLFFVEHGGLELASVCSFTICVGIAVDDTIHFLTRFQREYKKTDDLELAIHRSVRGVGAALLTTTVVLVVGFGVVTTSEIPVNRLFAGMGCTTIAAALVGDLVLLPALMKVVLGGKH